MRLLDGGVPDGQLNRGKWSWIVLFADGGVGGEKSRSGEGGVDVNEWWRGDGCGGGGIGKWWERRWVCWWQGVVDLGESMVASGGGMGVRGEELGQEVRFGKNFEAVELGGKQSRV